MNKSPISVLYSNNQDWEGESRVTWLDLPATRVGMDRAMKKLGFPDAANADARPVRYKTSLAGLAEHLMTNPNIEQLNRLAACLVGMNRAALRRFTLFLRTEQANDFSAILQHAEHLTAARSLRRQAPAPGR